MPAARPAYGTPALKPPLSGRSDAGQEAELYAAGRFANNSGHNRLRVTNTTPEVGLAAWNPVRLGCSG